MDPFWISRGFGYLFKCYVTACDIEHRTEAKEKNERAQRTLVGEKIGQQRGEGQWGKKKKTGITEDGK